MLSGRPARLLPGVFPRFAPDNLFPPDLRKDHIVFEALVVEDNDVLAFFHSQDIAELMGVVAAQQNLIAVKTIL